MQFELEYPTELITSVDGTFKAVDNTFKGFTTPRMSITSLVFFKTSKGRTSKTFGSVSGTKFVLESKGFALVGFHGWIQDHNCLGAIGAYFSPLPPPTTVEKLEAQGCDQGASWDDGIYDGVRKIYVGQRGYGIAFLKFVYDKDNQMVIGDDHGNKTPLEVKEVMHGYIYIRSRLIFCV